MDRLFTSPISLFWGTFTLLILLVVRSMVLYRWKLRKMPPGPSGIPLLGNALQVPNSMPWFRFTEWTEKYGRWYTRGPIYSLDLAGQPVVILNSHKVVADLFDRRSNIYSDRPRFIMASEILTGGIFMIFTNYGEVWRKMRRAAHEEFNLRASEKYQSDHYKEAALNLLDILNDPDTWVDRLKQTTASSILSAVYGWPRISPKDKPIITRIHAHTARIAGAVVPGAYLVELFPFMRFFPAWLAKWKRDGLEWHKQETEMFEKLNADVGEKTSLGNSPHCFVRGLIENEQRHGLSKKESAWLAGIMFSAGAETTLGSLVNFVLAMTLYPDVMRRAQAEIDAVVGRDRLPNFEDKEKLPYIRAIVKETLRWRPVGPLAVPRRVTEDDWYEGYLIPKGTTVIPNIWAMNRDPAVFPDFDEFRPERFLDETGMIDVTPPDTHGMGHVTFGFGRRICAGFNFANQVMFIQMATLLWALNFEKPLDAKGIPITPSRDDCIDAGVVVLPAPFGCKITARFPEVRSIIHRDLEHIGVAL